MSEEMAVISPVRASRAILASWAFRRRRSASLLRSEAAAAYRSAAALVGPDLRDPMSRSRSSMHDSMEVVCVLASSASSRSGRERDCAGARCA